jgi:hypothetical protein
MMRKLVMHLAVKNLTFNDEIRVKNTLELVFVVKGPKYVVYPEICGVTGFAMRPQP